MLSPTRALSRWTGSYLSSISSPVKNAATAVATAATAATHGLASFSTASGNRGGSSGNGRASSSSPLRPSALPQQMSNAARAAIASTKSAGPRIKSMLSSAGAKAKPRFGTDAKATAPGGKKAQAAEAQLDALITAAVKPSGLSPVTAGRLLAKLDELTPPNAHIKARVFANKAALRLSLGDGDGYLAAAERDIMTAIDLCDTLSASGSAVHFMVIHAETLLRADQLVRARDVLERACDLVRSRQATQLQFQVGPSSYAPLDTAAPFTLLAEVHSRLGDAAEGMRLLGEASQSISGTDDLSGRQRVRQLLAHAALAQSHTSLGVDPEPLIEEAVTTARSLPQTTAEGIAWLDGTAHGSCATLGTALTQQGYLWLGRATNLDKAAAVLQEAAALIPSDMVAVRPGVAERNSLQKRYGELLVNAAACVERDPSMLGSPLRSIALYRRGIEFLGPDAPETCRARVMLARAQSLSDRVDQALETLTAAERSLRSHPTSVQVDLCGKRGIMRPAEIVAHRAIMVLERVDDPKGAKLCFEAALREVGFVVDISNTALVSPDGKVAAPLAQDELLLAWLLEGLATTYGKLEMWSEAIRATQLCIAVCSMHSGNVPVRVQLLLASAYEGNRDFDDFFATLVSVIARPPEQLTRAQRHDIVLRLAWQYHYNRAQYADAVKMYKISRTLDPSNPHVTVQCAWCMLQLPGEENLRNAEDLYKEAEGVLLSAKNRKMLHKWDKCYVLGECAVFQHDFKKNSAEAERLYKLALNLEGRHSENFTQVACNYAVLLHYEKRETEAARAWFDKAMAANAKHGTSLGLYVHFLQNIEDHATAARKLDEFLQSAEADAVTDDLLHKRAKSEEHVGQEESVLRWYGVALRKLPLTTGAASFGSDAATASTIPAAPTSAAADPPPATTTVSKADVVSWISSCTAEQLPIAHDLCNYIHTTMRDLNMAKLAYHAVLSVFPSDLSTHFQLGKLFWHDHHNPKQATRHFQDALDADPANVNVLDQFAELLATTLPDRLDVAEALHIQSITLNPRCAQAHFAYATFLNNVLRSSQLAEKHFQAAMAIDPRDPITLTCYAAFLDGESSARGPAWEQHGAAVHYSEVLYREAARAAPSQPLHHLQLANFLLRHGKMTEAFSSFETAMTLTSHTATTLRLAAGFLQEVCVSTSDRSGGNRRGLPPSRTAPSLTFLSGDGDASQRSMADTAEILFRRAIELDPKDVETILALADFTEDVRMNTEAANAIRAHAAQIANASRLESGADADDA